MPLGGSVGLWEATARTAEECCEKTAELMKDKIWTFIKTIRVYLDAQVLRSGVVLADLPGLRDVNLAKFKATEQYLSKCDHVFIVAKISRAIPDQALHTTVMNEVRRRVPIDCGGSVSSHSRVTIVCTRADDVDVKALRKKFVGTGKAISLKVMARIDERRKAATKANDAELLKLIKQQEKRLLARARNNHVTRGVREACAKNLQGKKLKVFCIANREYWKRVADGNSQAVGSSNVPDLRRHCQSIPAIAQLLASRNFLLYELQSLLVSVNLWATNSLQRSRSNSERCKERKLERILLLGAEGETKIMVAKENLETLFKGQLLDLMGRESADWVVDGEQRSQAWARWHWATYKACCRRDGRHFQSDYAHFSWNVELATKMVTALQDAWTFIRDGISSIFRGFKTFFSTEMRDIRSYTLETPTFGESVELRLQSFLYDMDIIKRKLVRGVYEIEQKAAEDTQTSFVVEGMRNAYRKASEDHGPGTSKRQLKIVKTQIRKSLFPLAIEQTQAHVDQLISESIQRLTEKVTDTLTLTRADIELAYSRPDAEHDESKAEADSCSKTWERELDDLREEAEPYWKELNRDEVNWLYLDMCVEWSSILDSRTADAWYSTSRRLRRWAMVQDLKG